jgi:hypothetical protein
MGVCAKHDLIRSFRHPFHSSSCCVSFAGVSGEERIFRNHLLVAADGSRELNHLHERAPAEVRALEAAVRDLPGAEMLVRLFAFAHRGEPPPTAHSRGRSEHAAQA